MRDLGVLRQSMGQVFVFSSPNPATELLGISREDSRAFRFAFGDARASIDEAVWGDAATEGPGEVSAEVDEVGLHVQLTAALGQEWPGAVRLVTTPRVVALWRACVDLARRSWIPDELETVSGYRIHEWDAVQAMLEPFDPVIVDAYRGSYRPGKPYSEEEQGRLFGELLKS